ncbi:hypothetical protein BO71DRAFT_399414 [Aspergillus ellipticus CBS 707.79]|uniref:Uncharacterized protein n=1 Tax=Aspergillus ellipticus CBS 707.79 TaxID=1448320 RepID=A0A319ES58_9EURO|nr:hypothetical protein BO71DRAFT_399414 [Aspergillus ellipticus CBS 707.79]
MVAPAVAAYAKLLAASAPTRAPTIIFSPPLFPPLTPPLTPHPTPPPTAPSSLTPPPLAPPPTPSVRTPIPSIIPPITLSPTGTSALTSTLTSILNSTSNSTPLCRQGACRFKPLSLRLTNYNNPLPCICKDLLFDALDGSLGDTSSSEPAEFTLRHLRRIIDPIERMSFCIKCRNEDALVHLFYMICDGIVDQYSFFYQSLLDDFGQIDEEDYDVSFWSGLMPYIDLLYRQYAYQGERILASIDRFIRELRRQPGYDEDYKDDWPTVRNRAEQLVNATNELRTEPVFGKEMGVLRERCL